MKKSILINIALLLLIFNSFQCQKKVALEYQNDKLIQNVGIGLVQIINSKENVTVFTDSNLDKIKTKNAKVGNDFIPLLNKPDYGVLFFVCVEKGANFYKVAISKNEFAYLKNSSNLIFYNWENFLKEQVMGIESKDLKNNPPRNAIKGKPIDTKNWKSDDEIEILKVENTWLQVKNISKNQIFWIEWKDKDQLKVYLNLLV